MSDLEKELAEMLLKLVVSAEASLDVNGFAIRKVNLDVLDEASELLSKHGY